MDKNLWPALISIACGLFSACGGFFAWPFFMNHRKARTMANLIGENGARAFYVIIGLGLTGLGSALLLGFIH